MTDAFPVGGAVTSIECASRIYKASCTIAIATIRPGSTFNTDRCAIWKGIGQVWGSIRDPLPPPRDDILRYGDVGAGYSKYNAYDEAVRDRTHPWLRSNALNDRPWMLFVGFVAPHFPLIAPQAFIDRYPPDMMPLPKLQPRDGYVRHPWVEAQESFMATDSEFGCDDGKRRDAISAYYALCTMMDEHVGAICAAVDSAGPRRYDHRDLYVRSWRGAWTAWSLGQVEPLRRVHAGASRCSRTGAAAQGNLQHACQSHRSCTDFPCRIWPLRSNASRSLIIRCCVRTIGPEASGVLRGITRWERLLGHSCYAKDAGSYTSMWDSMPSCSISNPIPKKL